MVGELLKVAAPLMLTLVFNVSVDVLVKDKLLPVSVEPPVIVVDAPIVTDPEAVNEADKVSVVGLLITIVPMVPSINVPSYVIVALIEIVTLSVTPRVLPGKFEPEPPDQFAPLLQALLAVPFHVKFVALAFLTIEHKM